MHSRPVLRSFGLATLTGFLLVYPGYANTTWNNSGTDFNTASSWSAGIAGASDIAIFDVAEVTNPNLSASLAIQRLYFSTAAASGYDLTSSSGSIKLTLASTATGINSAISPAIPSETNTIDVTSYTLTNNIAGSTLTFSGPMNLSNDATNRTLTLNGSANTVISGAIANGSTSISKLSYSGTGTLTLSDSNIYSGTTTLTSGTLFLNNATGSATGTGAVNFNNASGTPTTLASAPGTSGAISGLVSTANANSMIIPGGAGTVGTLTLNGGLHTANGATFTFDLGSPSNRDAIVLAGGTFTGPSGTGALNIGFDGLSGMVANTSYQHFTYSSLSNLDAGDFSVVNSPSFGGTVFTVTSSEVDVIFSIVPEPSTFGMMLIGAMLLIGALRFRRSQR